MYSLIDAQSDSAAAAFIGGSYLFSGNRHVHRRRRAIGIAAKASAADAAGPDDSSAGVPGPPPMGNQGSALPAVLSFAGRRVRGAEDAGRQRQPGGDEGDVRAPIRAAA